MKSAPIPGSLTFYTDANKLVVAAYKAVSVSKIDGIQYKTQEFYDILMVLLDFNGSLNKSCIAYRNC